jgi:predicted dehydrogenase
MAYHQRMRIMGTNGQIELEIPFNPVSDQPARLSLAGVSGQPVSGTGRIETPPCDQYTIQGDRLSEAIRAGGPQPYALEESVGNMRVIDALFRSAADGGWVAIDEGGR